MSRFKKYLTTFILASSAGVLYYFVVFPFLFWFYDAVVCRISGNPNCNVQFTLTSLLQSYPVNPFDILVLFLLFLPPAVLSFGVTAVGIKENKSKGKSTENIVVFFLIVTFMFHVIPLVLLSGDGAFYLTCLDK